MTVPFDPVRRRRWLRLAAAPLALAALALSGGAQAATPMELELLGGVGSCTTDSVEQMESCVRVDGNSANYPDGTRFALEVDLAAEDAMGYAPVRFLDFWVPDVPIAFNGFFFVDAPAELTGVINRHTGELIMDPFDVMITGGMNAPAVDFPLTTESVASQDCASGPVSASLTGERMSEDPMNGGVASVSLVGSDCIEMVEEPMMLVLSGDVVSLPEPAEAAVGMAALATLAALRGLRSRRRRARA